MKINFQETTKDLAVRIDIHSKFGARDIDAWMLDLIQLPAGAKILDVGCGSGKQCFLYHDRLNGQADITGGDVSQELLNQAREANEQKKTGIKFDTLDFNSPFSYPDNTFDFLSCCFAIYYAENIPFTIEQMHRVTKPGGRLFTTGPMPQNKQVFYEIIKEATQRPIPLMPGSSRYSTEIYSTIASLYSGIELHIFENPLTFDSVEPYMAYTRASMSEDRKLWGDLFKEKDSFEKIMAQITEVARKWIDRDGKIVMTKVVGGILATK
ncbi:MAG TPA: methyltransferase domain-containing protein [Anaerolineaceae bacterium]|nr:methyltransferase domain-containing protein [Anaerolineaceae bacterium]